MPLDIDPEPPLRPLDAPLTDAELTALAMAADPDTLLDEDAYPSISIWPSSRVRPYLRGTWRLPRPAPDIVGGRR